MFGGTMNVGTLYPGANTSTPNTSTVLVTTGDLPAGYYNFDGIFCATVAAGFNFEVLDAADSVVQTMVVRVPANGTTTASLLYIPIGTNWEVRVRPLANITGGNSAAVSIVATPEARA